jgi:hypothetical protein
MPKAARLVALQILGGLGQMGAGILYVVLAALIPVVVRIERNTRK